MRILLPNDDGIEAPGLDVLEHIAGEIAKEVWVVAPETDQSGASHSLTLAEPLRMRELAKRRYAVKGTPTDCVIMGVRHLLKDMPPDLVLSGVNRGQNIAEDVTYSGTVAGAIEATLLGIPAFALSQAYGAASREALRWSCAERHAPGLIGTLLEEGFPKDVLVNLNFPDCEPDEVAGVATAAQGRRSADIFRIHERVDGRGNP